MILQSRSYNNHIVIPGREVLPELGDDTVSRAQVRGGGVYCVLLFFLFPNSIILIFSRINDF